MNFFDTPSPFQEAIWCDRKVYIKRDDLLHPFINGNKARKFKTLLEDNLKTKAIISYGGNQSNAMLTLSYIAKLKGYDFIYVTPPPSKILEQSPEGNFALAAQNGVQFEFYKPAKEPLNVNMLKCRALEISKAHNGFFIPQGGVCEISKTGIYELALELQKDIKNLKNPAIFYVSGSGASAGYLSEFLPCVFTTPAAGDTAYLKQIFSDMKISSSPILLDIKQKIPFAKPDIRLWEIYQEWLKIGIEFDLIYDCLGWLCLKESLKDFNTRDIVFIHSGGLSGNPTQIKRYEHKIGSR